MPSRVCVVIPARDAAGTLGATLDALAAQDGAPGFEVVVVDDGSRDATRVIAEGHPVVGRVLDGGGRGPGAARNAGVAAAAPDAQLIAFTDADCVPAPGWLAQITAALDDADLVQGRVEPERDAGPWDRTVSVERLSPLFETANLGVTRKLFDSLGGFEAWLAPQRGKELGEDVWLGWRARRAGARIAFAADAVVVHAVFDGTPRSFVAEQLRRRYFPELAARIPELRTEFLWRRWFLTRRSALFDLALAGVLTAIAARRPLALLAVLPYVREGRRTSGSLDVAAVAVAAAAVGAAALLSGSLRARTAVM